MLPQAGLSERPVRGEELALRPAAFAVREVSYVSDTCYPSHAHPYSSLFLVLHGCVVEQCGRKLTECTSGSVGFIPAGAEHRSRFVGGPAHTLSVTLEPAWLNSLGLHAEACLSHTSYAQSIVSASLGMRLYATFRASREARRLEREELLLELLQSALPPTAAARRAPRRERPTWVREVIDLLQASASEPLDLATVAATARRSPAHVCRGFRAAMGCSLSSYLTFVRITRACALLRTSRQSVVEIALGTGFYDQAHFTRTFRRLLRTTPSRYRAALHSRAACANSMQEPCDRMPQTPES